MEAGAEEPTTQVRKVDVIRQVHHPRQVSSSVGPLLQSMTVSFHVSFDSLECRVCWDIGEDGIKALHSLFVHWLARRAPTGPLQKVGDLIL